MTTFGLSAVPSPADQSGERTPQPTGTHNGLVLTGLTKHLGGRPVVQGLSISVGRGELLCLLGQSGCGKTTTLRMVGGFLPPDAGMIEVNGRDIGALPPERRPTAMVFQSYALWPHMSVSRNIAYGLKVRGLGRGEIRARVDAMLHLVGLDKHGDRAPAQLSGGEQQRVALARALILEPEVLLLDEPLSNLDAQLRLHMRDEIRELQQRLRITTVFVTHDQDEAMAISDRIAVMSGGIIQQAAAPNELYRVPHTRFVAEFVGSMSFFRARGVPGGARLPTGTVVPVLNGGAQTWADEEFAVRPEHVILSPADAGPEAGPLMTVLKRARRGNLAETIVDLEGQPLRAAAFEHDIIADRVRVRLRQALAYGSDGQLLASPAAPARRTPRDEWMQSS